MRASDSRPPRGTAPGRFQSAIACPCGLLVVAISSRRTTRLAAQRRDRQLFAPSYIPMSIRSVGRAGALLLLLALLANSASAGEVQVMTSGGFEAPFLALVAAFERTTGHRVVPVTTSMGVGANWIPTRIRRGDAADLVVLSDPVFSELVSEGRIVAASRTALARS